MKRAAWTCIVPFVRQQFGWVLDMLRQIAGLAEKQFAPIATGSALATTPVEDDLTNFQQSSNLFTNRHEKIGTILIPRALPPTHCNRVPRNFSINHAPICGLLQNLYPFFCRGES